MYYPAAVKSVNLSAHPSLRGRRRGGEGLSALRATSWQTAEKVSHGLGRECATRSVAVDGDGGTGMEDGGGSVGPQGLLVEMMQGLRARRWPCYIWRSIVTSGKGRPGHLFTSSTLKYINKTYPTVSVTCLRTHTVYT